VQSQRDQTTRRFAAHVHAARQKEKQKKQHKLKLIDTHIALTNKHISTDSTKTAFAGFHGHTWRHASLHCQLSTNKAAQMFGIHFMNKHKLELLDSHTSQLQTYKQVLTTQTQHLQDSTATAGGMPHDTPIS
jgi:hypothetical protein